jgi:AcrR family transcriptional regulator
MHDVCRPDKSYPRGVPKLWRETVEEHRRDVRAAILETAWTLAGERGLRGVTMGAVAGRSGIARATLYKYFSGVDEILIAAHADHVTQHLTQLEAARAGAASAGEGLHGMLAGYARICFHRGKTAPLDLHGLVHEGPQHERSQSELVALFSRAVRDAQDSGQLRNDIAAPELAAYCVNALEAAVGASTRPALDRLVDLVAEALHLTAGGGRSAPDVK